MLHSGIARAVTTVDATVTPIDGGVVSCRDSRCLAIFDTTAEAVQITLSYDDILVRVLELEYNCVHPVDCLLESFEVCGDSDDVLVKCLDFEFVVGEVTLHVILVGLLLNESV